MKKISKTKRKLSVIEKKMAEYSILVSLSSIGKYLDKIDEKYAFHKDINAIFNVYNALQPKLTGICPKANKEIKDICHYMKEFLQNLLFEPLKYKSRKTNYQYYGNRGIHGMFFDIANKKGKEKNLEILKTLLLLNSRLNELNSQLSTVRRNLKKYLVQCREAR